MAEARAIWGKGGGGELNKRQFSVVLLLVDQKTVGEIGFNSALLIQLYQYVVDYDFGYRADIIGEQLELPSCFPPVQLELVRFCLRRQAILSFSHSRTLATHYCTSFCCCLLLFFLVKILFRCCCLEEAMELMKCVGTAASTPSAVNRI